MNDEWTNPKRYAKCLVDSFDEVLDKYKKIIEEKRAAEAAFTKEAPLFCGNVTEKGFDLGEAETNKKWTKAKFPGEYFPQERIREEALPQDVCEYPSEEKFNDLIHGAVEEKHLNIRKKQDAHLWTTIATEEEEKTRGIEAAAKDLGRKEKYCDGCFGHTILKDLPCLQYEKKTAVFTIPSECPRIGSKDKDNE